MNNAYIKSRHFSLKQFLITFLVFGILTTGQMMILQDYLAIESIPVGFVFGITGYWLVVTIVFCLLTHVQIRLRFEKPMQMLGAAAKSVASGDFSVSLKPLHRDNKRDYMDAMFEDFNKMVEELGSIETLKTDFIADVSHELKTPLAVIQNYATALKDENATDESRRFYVDTITDSSLKLGDLISNILRINKLENQKIRLEYTTYDLSRQLSDCLIAFENRWEEKQLELNIDIPDRCLIHSDMNMLELVWNNLLTNAIKFSDKGGKLFVRQFEDDQAIIVSIQDCGCGIEANKIEHIFEKFYQGERSRHQEGNGLGLALTLKIIDLLGGQILVDSKINVGSTFTVRKPKT